MQQKILAESLSQAEFELQEKENLKYNLMQQQIDLEERMNLDKQKTSKLHSSKHQIEGQYQTLQQQLQVQTA